MRDGSTASEVDGVLDPASEFTLSPADAHAIDALVDASFNTLDLPENISSELRDRTSAATRLLENLGTPLQAEADRTLADLIMLRIARDSLPAELCADDDEALDAWMMARGDLNRVPSALRQRAEQIERTAQLVTSPAPAVDGIAAQVGARTYLRIERKVANRNLRFTNPPPRHRRRIPIRELVSMAAVLILGAAVVIPVLGGMRQRAMNSMCASNMQAAAMGFGFYAGDHDDNLPTAGTLQAGAMWSNVGAGPGKSNAANLFTLVSNGYASLGDLACPGNNDAVTAGLEPHAVDWERLEQVSYSYRVLFGLSQNPRWNSGSPSVVLADRSPILLANAQRKAVKPEANSPNHRGSGQRILFSDGSAAWRTTPIVLHGDNIWLPLPIEEAIRHARGQVLRSLLQGSETPQDTADAFLGP